MKTKEVKIEGPTNISLEGYIFKKDNNGIVFRPNFVGKLSDSLINNFLNDFRKNGWYIKINGKKKKISKFGLSPSQKNNLFDKNGFDIAEKDLIICGKTIVKKGDLWQKFKLKNNVDTYDLYFKFDKNKKFNKFELIDI